MKSDNWQEINELFPEEGKQCLPFMMLDPMREQAAQEEAADAVRA